MSPKFLDRLRPGRAGKLALVGAAVAGASGAGWAAAQPGTIEAPATLPLGQSSDSALPTTSTTSLDVEGQQVTVPVDPALLPSAVDSQQSAADTPGTDSPGTNSPNTNSPGTNSPLTDSGDTPDGPDDADNSNSGPGAGGGDEDNSNSGPGAGGGDDDNSNSGPGAGGGGGDD